MDEQRLDEWMHWKQTRGGRLAWMLLTPARVTVGIGSLMAILGSFMPWAEGQAPAHNGIEAVFFNGLGGSGDGIILLFTSLGAGLLTLHRTPATSRVRTVRLLPALFVVLAALTWINGYRASLLVLEGWAHAGGSAQIAPGLWIALGGIVLMAAGTLILLPEVIRWRREAGDPSDVVSVGVRDIAEVVGGLAGVILGGWAGIVGAIALLGPTIMGSIEIGAIAGGIVGAYAGSRAGRTIADRLAPRKKAADTMGRHGPRP